MGMWLRYGIVGLSALILLGVIALQLLASGMTLEPSTLDAPLTEAIPAQLEGWKVEDLPLGNTELLEEASREILNLDDYVHREYSRGTYTFSVYVAYWRPGKMPVRLINQHTPDRCWLDNGWTCVERDWEIDVSGPGVELQPAQFGIYEIHGQQVNVYFWHVLGEKAVWFPGRGLNNMTPVVSVVRDFEDFTLRRYEPQFLIQVRSNQPIERLWKLEGFREVMRGLRELCLGVVEPEGLAERPFSDQSRELPTNSEVL